MGSALLVAVYHCLLVKTLLTEDARSLRAATLAISNPVKAEQQEPPNSKQPSLAAKAQQLTWIRAGE